MQAKVCGLSTTKQVETCVEYGADFCGFILNYKKSHRFISYKVAEQLTKIDKKKTTYVGVFVDPTIEELKTFSKLDLDYFQIYGNFSNDEIIQFKEETQKKIIMALQIKREQDVLQYKSYEKDNEIYFQYNPTKEKIKKVIKKTNIKDSPFKVLKNINFN